MKLFTLSLLLLSSTSAFADNLDVTCRTLGDVGQCERVTICREQVEGMCVANANAIRSNPEWATMCPKAGVNEMACGWQSSFCHWEAVAQCVPLRR